MNNARNKSKKCKRTAPMPCGTAFKAQEANKDCFSFIPVTCIKTIVDQLIRSLSKFLVFC